MKETFTRNQWEMWHFGWLLGLVLVSSMLAINTFHQTLCHAPSFMNAAFTDNISNDLMHTKEESPLSMIEGYEPPITEGPPKLPKGMTPTPISTTSCLQLMHFMGNGMELGFQKLHHHIQKSLHHFQMKDDDI